MSTFDPHRLRLDRREALATALGLAAGAGLVTNLPAPAPAAAQEQGPLNPYRSPQRWADFPANVDPARFAPLQRITTGQTPVALIAPDAGVDAAIEISDVVDGSLADPTGPWVVAWYPSTAGPGSEDNVVMAGHVDYWNVGPAVFWGIPSLPVGSIVEVVTDRNESYRYQVEWVQNFQTASLDQATLNEITGRKDSEALTLITCGGDWDQNAREYLSRIVARCVPAV